MRKRVPAVELFVLTAAVAAVGCNQPGPGPAAKAPSPPPASPAVAAGPATPVGPAVPAGTLLADDGFSYAFVVYSAARPKVDPRKTVTKLLAAGPLGIGEGAPPESSQTPLVWLSHPSLQARPRPASPEKRGFEPADERTLEHAGYQTLLELRGPPTQALMAYAHALAMAAALADAARAGVIYDAATDEVYSRAAWTKRIDGWSDNFPNIVPNVHLRSTREGDQALRMGTLGMAKLALPDVIVDGVAPADERAMTNLLELVCQTLMEGARLSTAGKLPLAVENIKQTGFREALTGTLPAGGKRAATIDLARGERHEDDPPNRLIEIVFPGPAAQLQARRAALVADLFGRP